MKSARASLSIVLIAVATLTGCSTQRQPSFVARYDKPQEAYDFEREQRLAWAGEVDPRAKYREAVAWADRAESLQSAERSSARWQEAGPGNIGGRSRALVIDPVNPQRMILGGVSGGLWRTDDGGENWRPVGDALSNLAINSMTLDPVNPATVYAGTGEGYFREEVRATDLPLRGGGVFVSHDFGDTWTYLESTASSDFYWVNDLAVSASDSQRVYAATRTGVLRSRDGGSTWSRALSTDAKGGCLDLALRAEGSADVLLASCGTLAPAKVFRSDNAAAEPAAWAAVLAEEGMGRTSLAVSRSSPDYVYALSARNAPGDEEHDQALFAIFRSDHGGAAGSWTAVARGDGADLQSTMLSNASLDPTCSTGAKPRYWVNMGWYTNVIAVDPVNPMRVWVGGVYLYRSDDGGASWGLAGGDIHVDQHAIVFSPRYDGAADRTMYVTNDGGIFKSTDATASVGSLQQICSHSAPQMSWTPLNHSLGVTQLYHGTIAGNTSVLLAGSQDNGLLRSGSGVNTWNEIAGGDVGYSVIDPANPKVIYAMTAFGIMQKSTNGGTLFTGLRTPPPDTGFLFITPMVLDGRSPSTLWIGGSRIWRSTDGAATWIGATATLADGAATALATSPHDANELFVGTNSGAIYHSNSARSAVNESWEMTIPRRGFVSSIAADARMDDSVFATYSGFGGAHVWQSRDAGRTWNEIDGIGTGRLPDLPVHCIAIDNTSGELFVATDLGVFSSSNGGSSWTPAGTGLPRVVTKWLEIGISADGHRELVAFTHGRGAWRMELVPNVVRRHAVRR